MKEKKGERKCDKNMKKDRRTKKRQNDIKAKKRKTEKKETE